jgi:hypothetical protein
MPALYEPSEKLKLLAISYSDFLATGFFQSGSANTTPNPKPG